MEDRKPGIQLPEEVAGKYRACMQFSGEGTEKSLSDGTDIRFHEAALRVLLPEEKGDKKNAKNISSELLASFGRQLTEPEDIPVKLNDSVLN